MLTGIILSCVPLIGWGIGDFLIQRSTRTIGVFKTLFFICALSVPVLFPFVYSEIRTLTSEQIYVLTTMSFVMFTFALALFSAFKIGKVAVIESVLGLELPFTVALAILVGGEEMGTGQTIIFLIICIGVILASTKTFEIVSIHKRLFEKGVMLAFAAAGLSALSNYTMGISAQQVSPLMAVWYMHTVIGVLSLIALIISKEIFEIEHDLRTHPFLICGQSFFDNIAWIGYTYAVTYVPISTVAAISVSYVILASFLGYWFGHERLTSRQKIGSAIALPAVVLFAILSSAS